MTVGGEEARRQPALNWPASAGRVHGVPVLCDLDAACHPDPVVRLHMVEKAHQCRRALVLPRSPGGCLPSDVNDR